MWTRHVPILAAILALWVSPSVAQVQSLAELEGRLKSGAKLIVYDEMQRKTRVTFKGVSPEGLVVAPDEEDGYRTFFNRSVAQSRTIPPGQILRIEEERSDGLGKGTGIGLAIGGGIALAAIATCSEDHYSGDECVDSSLVVLTFGGMALGALIDAAVKERVTIYQAPRGSGSSKLSLGPLVTRRGVGARLAWTF